MVTVSLAQRMRRLRTLLDIRLGPGAAIISPSIKRIHLNFALKYKDGHMGPRKFWRTCLPRLKYHNPAIPMTVERTTDQEGPATLTVFFAEAGTQGVPAATGSTSGDTASSEHSPLEGTKSIDMKHKTSGDILNELMVICDGKPVVATAVEEEQLRELEEERGRAEVGRARQEKVVRDKKRQEELLKAAKQSVGGT